MKNTLLLLSLIVSQVHAQIIYTDVVPDAVYNLNGDTCRLDLNNDGSTDFYIRYYKKPGNACNGCTNGPPGLHPSWVKIDALSTHAVANGATYPSSLPPDSVIDPSLTWVTAIGQTLSSLSSQCTVSPVLCVPHMGSGEWFNGISADSSRYLGLRFSAGGFTYYGWARLSIPGSTLVVASFTLKDYAYNSMPDEFILAGDTGDLISTGIARIAHPSVQVTPNPFSSTLSISIGAAKPGVAICTVRSLTGQMLAMRTIARSSGRSSCTLDLASLAPGVYILDVVIDGEHVVRKVMKE